MTFPKRFVFFPSSIVIAVFLHQSPCFGCSCVDRKATEREDVVDQVGRADLVFEGQIESMRIGVRDITNYRGGPGLDLHQLDHYGLYRVRALRVYKGRSEQSYEIVSGTGGGDCGLRLQIG